MAETCTVKYFSLTRDRMKSYFSYTNQIIGYITPQSEMEKTYTNKYVNFLKIWKNENIKTTAVTTK